MRVFKKLTIILYSFVVYMILTFIGCSSEVKDDLEKIEDNIENFFKDPNTEPIRATIKTGVPLGVSLIVGIIPSGIFVIFL